MNTTIIENALKTLQEEMATCPLNPNGKYNGNARNKRVDTCATMLQTTGMTRDEACSMAFAHAPKAPK